MSADLEWPNLMTEFVIKICERSLAGLREGGVIADHSNPVCVVMLLVDFETEVSMNGISEFVGNTVGIYARETVGALVVVGWTVTCGRRSHYAPIPQSVTLPNPTTASPSSHSDPPPDVRIMPPETATVDSPDRGELKGSPDAHVRLGLRSDIRAKVDRPATSTHRSQICERTIRRGSATCRSDMQRLPQS